MPPKKQHLALAAAQAKGREVIAEKSAALTSETANENLWNELQTANSRIETLELLLAQRNSECTTLQSELEKAHNKLAKLQADSDFWKSKHEDTYRELRLQHQTTKRKQEKANKLELQIEILKKAETEASSQFLRGAKQSETALAVLREKNEGLHSELSKCMAKWTTQLEKAHSKLDASVSDLRTLRKEAWQLRKTVVHSKETKKRAIAAVKEQISQRQSVHHLMAKGVFTEETHNVIRLLVKAGCSRNYINEVIFTILQSAGITTVGTISRTSVSRILREGYFAAQIQLGYEMKNAKSMTFSADGTSHRSINYNSRHVHLRVEDYASQISEDNTKQQATRTLGIQSSLDGSSEMAVADWENTLKKITLLYNESPLGKRSGSLLKFVDLLVKLMGMNTDHCAKEKKDARMLEELMAWAVGQQLGEEKMLEMSLEEIAEHFNRAEEKMIKKAGGLHKWEILSDIKKAEKRAIMLEETVGNLGEEAFDNLTEEEKRIFKLFIWAGCGCHKDLNTVRGGYLAMLKWWNENESGEVVRPILLANRDNNPVVQERAVVLEQGNVPTPAQERAFHKSTRGAIKTAEIAGAIFNHKDNKKGHHDIFRYWWWEHVGIPFTFPDTSNNRFQSYCDAAAALILYSTEFINFLESLRINKHNSTLNHMETNLWNALHCSSTITELAVLAIYAESISYPYMKAIRASSDRNMLNLGPLHSCVHDHMQKIIDNPNILVGANVPFENATLDGKEWQNPAVIQKILDLIPTLPHFHNLFIAFFQGAAETWMRFTSEFAPGGLIDEATAEERELA